MSTEFTNRHRVVWLRRDGGQPGIPEGRFSRLAKEDFLDQFTAEVRARELLDNSFIARVIRVELHVQPNDDYVDISFEAERCPNGTVAWYIGPPAGITP